MPLPEKKEHTTADILALPPDVHAELLDGQIYIMESPKRIHQHLVMRLSYKILNHILAENLPCEVYPAPFAVFIGGVKDIHNYLEPDISVICETDRLNEDGCDGAPDWVIEITSPSTQKRDVGVKLFKYRSAGVKLYWIVNPQTQTVVVHDFAEQETTGIYSFDTEIPVAICGDFSVRISELMPKR